MKAKLQIFEEDPKVEIHLDALKATFKNWKYWYTRITKGKTTLIQNDSICWVSKMVIAMFGVSEWEALCDWIF